MEEGSPVFSHLFSSPLAVQEGSRGLVAVDELDYLSERRALKQLLEKSNWVDIRWKSTHCSITNFLDAYTNCKIMHFTGHGEQGVLAFENNFGILQWVSHEELTEMCQGLTDKPEIVFLSACYGLTSSQAFVDLGIPHVVSVTADRVLDQASLEFTNAFYSSIFSGKSVASSFQLGVARLVAQYPTEKDKFRLLGKIDCHDVCLFATRSPAISRPHFDSAVAPLPPSQCYSSASFSLGRSVYGLLQNGIKLINLTGPRGVGKTEIALKVVEYARERYKFSRFLFFDFSNFTDFSEELCLEKLANIFTVSDSTPVAVDSIFSFARSADVDGTLETIRQHLPHEDQSLLVLDGLDYSMSASSGGQRKEFFKKLVTKLLQILGGSVSLLITSCTRLEVESSREIPVEGLTDYCAAHLFALRAPRPLETDEFILEGSPVHDPIKAFSRSKLLQSMKGNCRVIQLVAKELQHDGQPQNLLRYQTYFREEIVPNIIYQVQMGCANHSPLTWTGVQHHLITRYRQVIGIELCRARPLTSSSFDFFASCPAWGESPGQVPALNGYQIQPSSYQRFFSWFDGIMQALKKSCLWGRPHCIFGFISRQTAATVLKASEVGTFLIGVSQSEACLVINVVTSPGSVLPVKVKFNADSPNPFSFNMKHGMTTSYSTLEDLIRNNGQLLYFYPSFPLENGSATIPKDTLCP